MKVKSVKKMLLFIIVIVIVTLLASLSFGGCKQQASSETTAAETTVAETTAAETTAAETESEAEPITLNLWSWSASVTGLAGEQLAADILKEKHPNITVNRTVSGFDVFWTQFKAAVAGDLAPDIMSMQPDRAATLGKEGVLLDLKPFIEADAEWNEWMEPVRWAGEGVKNRQFWFGDNMDQNLLIPLTLQTYVVLYNKTIYPNGFPKTSDEWIEEAKRINAMEGLYPIVVPWVEKNQRPDFFVGLVSQFDREAIAKVEAGEIKWTDDVFVEAMNSVKALWDNNVFSKEAFTHGWSTDMYELFMAGKAGAIYPGLEVMAATFEAKGMDLSDVGVAYWPLAKEGNNYTHLSGFSGTYAAPAQGKHTDIAVEYLKILSSPEVRSAVWEKGGPTPYFEGKDTKGPGTKYPDLWKEFEQLSLKIPGTFRYLANADVFIALDIAITNVCLGTQSVEDALADVQKAAD